MAEEKKEEFRIPPILIVIPFFIGIVILYSIVSRWGFTEHFLIIGTIIASGGSFLYLLMYYIKTKKESKTSYTTRYEQLESLAKDQCPTEIKDYELRLSGDRDHAGVKLGRIKKYVRIMDPKYLNEERLKVTVTSIFHQWSQHTMNQHSASCRWQVFNSSTLGTSGIECRSTAGADWCDRTYERCKQLNNSSHFGGFRFLPDIVDKEIWWGRLKST